jgi:hypothetical protein
MVFQTSNTTIISSLTGLIISKIRRIVIMVKDLEVSKINKEINAVSEQIEQTQ